MLQPQQSPVAVSGTEIVPENYFQRLDLRAIYGRTAPVEVDLGCGDGALLVELAAHEPGHDFLGIERLRGRVRKANSKILRRGLTNARVIWIENSYAVQYLLPPSSVAVFHLMFPDPWPKRRHQRRRLVNQDFFSPIRRALIPNGLFRVATDQIDYFEQVARLIDRMPGFVQVADPVWPSAVSTFEKHFRDCGIEIHHLALRKISPET